MKVNIRYDGVYACVEGKLSQEVHDYLESRMIYVNPEDLNDVKPLYKDGTMLHGMVHRAVKLLSQKGVVAQIIDDQYPKKRFKWRFKGTYRANQKPALEALWARTRGAMEATMGAGKSAMIAATAVHYGASTLVLAYTLEPYQTLVDDAVKLTNMPISMYNGDTKQLGDVVYATVPSILAGLRRKDKELRRFLRNVEVVLVDECHHGAADGTLTIFDRLKKVKVVYGFSGTVRRADDKGDLLLGVVGAPTRGAKVSYERQIDTKDSVPVTLVVEYIPPKEYTMQAAKSWMRKSLQTYSRIKTISEDYIVAGSTGYNERIVRWVKRQMRKGRTIGIRVKLLDHAEELRRKIPGAVCILGAKSKQDKEQNKVLWDKFYHREIKCVISTLLQEGTNIPSMDSVVYAGGGRSSISAEQGLRNTRKCEAQLRTGHYKKKRGFVYIPMCQCEYLDNHSKATLKILKALMDTHEKNKIVYKNEPYVKSKTKVKKTYKLGGTI